MRKDVYNFKITKKLEVAENDMPKVQPFSEKDLSCEFLLVTPFNYFLTETQPQSKLLHFYLDDYQFERIWNKPEIYVPGLKKFNAVIGPDFSMFTNLPKPQQLYNNWRNKVLMAYWQNEGVKVIPNVQWSDEESFEYCFSGLPPNSVVAISTTGCHGSAKEMFLKGYRKMLKELSPAKILVVGTLLPELQNDERVIKIDSFMEQRRKLWVEEEVSLKI